MLSSLIHTHLASDEDVSEVATASTKSKQLRLDAAFKPAARRKPSKPPGATLIVARHLYLGNGLMRWKGQVNQVQSKFRFGMAKIASIWMQPWKMTREIHRSRSSLLPMVCWCPSMPSLRSPIVGILLFLKVRGASSMSDCLVHGAICSRVATGSVR